MLLLALLTSGKIHGQATIEGSFMHGGINRTYSFYVPASYVPGEPLPLVIGLHGLSSSGADFAQYRDFRPIADTANFIVAHPDGSTLFGQRFWNYANILGSTVDDVGFLEALIDTIAGQYVINAQRVYCVGMSNGSFMAYKMACASDRFAAVGGVTGSMGVSMLGNCTPPTPTPVIHIHGTEDDTNPYAGTSTMVGIEALMTYWVDHNSCDPTPQIFPVPDNDPNDGATAERHLYTGGINGSTVEHFKVIGGGHSWPNSPMPGSSEITCMDFDASVEIWRFFSQYGLGLSTSAAEVVKQHVAVWPNPTNGPLHLQSGGFPITGIQVLDMQGRVVMESGGSFIQFVDLGHLHPGPYVVKISGAGFAALKRVVLAGE
jgi:polyhydroxybutyrate depolymerase